MLAGDERRSSGSATLLPITVGEAHAFLGNAVDVRRSVAHQPVAVAAQVGNADIIAPNHDDVRFVRLSHLGLPSEVSEVPPITVARARAARRGNSTAMNTNRLHATSFTWAIAKGARSIQRRPQRDCQIG